MPERSIASNEHANWLDGIGLSAPVSSAQHFDEIPGFVNSGVFGRFSLDDLDFGEDMTKGRIDFDDEYLLKSPGMLAGGGFTSGLTGTYGRGNMDYHTESRTPELHGSPSKVQHEQYGSRPSAPQNGQYSSRPSAPQSESGGSYSPSYGEAGREALRPSKRQMPTSGITAQESLFAGFADAARTLGVDSKFMDSVKNYMDKAPTQRKLRLEERRSARKDPTRKDVKKTQAVPAPMQADMAAPPKAKPARARRDRRGKKANPFIFIVVFMLLVRLSASIFQAVMDHTTTEPPGGEISIDTHSGGFATVTPGGVVLMPEQMVTDWEDVFERLSAVREANSLIPFTEFTVDETAAYLTDNGWELVTVNKEGEDSYVEAELVQDASVAGIYVDSTTVRLMFDWNTVDRPSNEIKDAWQAILPDDETMYPGTSELQLLVSPDMAQIIRICGKQADYGRIREYYTQAGSLFISIFDNTDSGWDLYVTGKDGCRVSMSTDNPDHYLERLEINGSENENFR